MLPVAEIAKAAQNGSPMLLQAVGRAFGLGEQERAALGGGLPGWFWMILGVAGGVVVGVQIHKRWPDKIPKVLGGGK